MTILFLSGCGSVLPWSKENPRDEVNMAFVLDGNLVRLQTTQVEGRPGTHLFSTALPRSVVDSALAAQLGPAPRRGYAITIGEKQTRNIRPVVGTLAPVADVILGADLIGNRAVTIDYALGMVTYQQRGIFPGLMTLYRYEGAPSITVTVNGREMQAIVDTVSPEALVLPGGSGRATASVTVAGATFDGIDVLTAPVTDARIGNRLLVNFLVSIDYGQKVIGLYHDPRTIQTPRAAAAADASVDRRGE